MFSGRKFLFKSKHFCSCIFSKMSSSSEDSLLKAAEKLVPSLSASKYKGQDGRIGIIGGSLEYSGAPFFAGMSALRTGADLVHIFCSKEASTSIKSFSPELIVHPVLNDGDAINKIQPWLDRLHVILIGPGLGRENKVFETVSQLITICRGLSKPLVIDADGLFLVGEKPELIKNYPGLILTPNAMEFTRLVKTFLNKSVKPTPNVDYSSVKELAETIGEQVLILHKGNRDVIVDGRKGAAAISCGISGSGRRCGGQGDLLSGSLAVFTWWSKNCPSNLTPDASPSMVACYAACRLVRECNAAAFTVNHRGTLASDMLKEISPTFAKFFEANSCL